MGIEWIVFGAVWLAMAGFSFRGLGEMPGADVNEPSKVIAILLVSIAFAPFIFGGCLRYVLK